MYMYMYVHIGWLLPHTCTLLWLTYIIHDCTLCVSLAYQHTFNARVVDVISEWGSLYVLLKDGRVSLV